MDGGLERIETRPEWKGDAIGVVVIAAIAVGMLRVVCSRTAFVCGASAISLAATWFASRLPRRRCLIDDDGIELTTTLRTTFIKWNDAYYTCRCRPDASRTSEEISGRRWLIQGLVIAAIAFAIAAALRSVRRAGRWLVQRFAPANMQTFTTETIVHGRGGGALSLDALVADRDLRERIIDEIHRRNTAASAPFTVTDDGVAYRDEVVSFASIECVELAQRLKIRVTGRRLAWCSIPLHAVPDLWCLVEQLALRDVVLAVCADPPRALARTIAISAQRRLALPRAEIRRER